MKPLPPDPHRRPRSFAEATGGEEDVKRGGVVGGETTWLVGRLLLRYTALRPLAVVLKVLLDQARLNTP